MSANLSNSSHVGNTTKNPNTPKTTLPPQYTPAAATTAVAAYAPEAAPSTAAPAQPSKAPASAIAERVNPKDAIVELKKYFESSQSKIIEELTQYCHEYIGRTLLASAMRSKRDELKEYCESNESPIKLEVLDRGNTVCFINSHYLRQSKNPESNNTGKADNEIQKTLRFKVLIEIAKSDLELKTNIENIKRWLPRAFLTVCFEITARQVYGNLDPKSKAMPYAKVGIMCLQFDATVLPKEYFNRFSHAHELLLGIDSDPTVAQFLEPNKPDEKDTQTKIITARLLTSLEAKDSEENELGCDLLAARFKRKGTHHISSIAANQPVSTTSYPSDSEINFELEYVPIVKDTPILKDIDDYRSLSTGAYVEDFRSEKNTELAELAELMRELKLNTRKILDPNSKESAEAKANADQIDKLFKGQKNLYFFRFYAKYIANLKLEDITPIKLSNLTQTPAKDSLAANLEINETLKSQLETYSNLLKKLYQSEEEAYYWIRKLVQRVNWLDQSISKEIVAIYSALRDLPDLKVNLNKLKEEDIPYLIEKLNLILIKRYKDIINEALKDNIVPTNKHSSSILSDYSKVQKELEEILNLQDIGKIETAAIELLNRNEKMIINPVIYSAIHKLAIIREFSEILAVTIVKDDILFIKFDSFINACMKFSSSKLNGFFEVYETLIKDLCAVDKDLLESYKATQRKGVAFPHGFKAKQTILTADFSHRPMVFLRDRVKCTNKDEQGKIIPEKVHCDVELSGLQSWDDPSTYHNINIHGAAFKEKHALLYPNVREKSHETRYNPRSVRMLVKLKEQKQNRERLTSHLKKAFIKPNEIVDFVDTANDTFCEFQRPNGNTAYITTELSNPYIQDPNAPNPSLRFELLLEAQKPVALDSHDVIAFRKCLERLVLEVKHYQTIGQPVNEIKYPLIKIPNAHEFLAPEYLNDQDACVMLGIDSDPNVPKSYEAIISNEKVKVIFMTARLLKSTEWAACTDKPSSDNILFPNSEKQNALVASFSKSGTHHFTKMPIAKPPSKYIDTPHELVPVPAPTAANASITAGFATTAVDGAASTAAAVCPPPVTFIAPITNNPPSVPPTAAAASARATSGQMPAQKRKCR